MIVVAKASPWNLNVVAVSNSLMRSTGGICGCTVRVMSRAINISK
jgi:hypothetical protein